MCGVQLLVELPHVIARRDEQVAVEPGEVAGDLLVADDALNPIDGRSMTLSRQAGALSSVQPLEMVETVIQRAHQMRGRPARLTARAWPIVDHDRALALLRQEVRRGQPRDAGADDADVSALIGRERRLPRHCRSHPDRRRSSVISHRHTSQDPLPAPLPVTRQMVLPTSSATSSAPRPSMATPTGRPIASPFSRTNPVSRSTGMPDGLPSANGTKITL